MATVQQLIKRTNYLIDDQIETDIALEFFNEALEDLSNVAAIESTHAYPLNEGVLTLPIDLVELVAVYVETESGKRKATLVTDRDLDQHSAKSFTFRLFGSELEIFPKPTRNYQVKIEYFRQIPKLPMDDYDTPLEVITKLPERYHKAISIYCALQYAENDDNLYKINNLRQAYERIRQEMKEEMDRKRARTRSNRVAVQVGWY